MTKPNAEQKAEYEAWLKQQPNHELSSDVVRGVIDDDMAEAAEREKKREGWSRDYNAKVIDPSEKREVLEEEPHHEAD